MSKEVSFENHDRFIQLGVAISSLKKSEVCRRKSLQKKQA